MEFRTCTCGHDEEEHGADPKYPGSRRCHGKDVIVGAVDKIVDCDCDCFEEDDEPEAP